MKRSSIIVSLSYVFILFAFTSCKKDELLAPGCYRATLVGIDCAYIVTLEGLDIGVNWRGVKNCVTVTNLPSDAKQIGSTLYFTSYDTNTDSGPFCTTERIYDFPQIFIELVNYSKTNCSEE